jgi:cytochrome c-type biogenesis protein CcmI
MIVALQLLLLVLVGAFVLTPLIRFRGQHILRETSSANQHRNVDERKTRLYRQLVDLDFDRDSGKLSADDHARMREETMGEVLKVLAEEERLGLKPAFGSPAAAATASMGTAAAPGGAAAISDQVEKMIEEMKKRRAASVEGSKA